jgi:ankyrin repeat protein
MALHCHFHLTLDVNLQRDSATALMYAAASGHDPIVSLLLAGKLDVDQADKVRLSLEWDAIWYLMSHSCGANFSR